tara:strand:- start:13 stop:918 length:906 start_codon:yes stop_codon:yes gene_type:complete
MRILLTGANGQFGTSFRNLTNNIFNFSNDKLISFTRKDLDLLDENACRKTIESINPDLIINAAAYTAVDRAEIEPEIAYAINSKAPLIFAEVLLKTGGKLIQFSSDFVFDGKSKIPYETNEKTNPLNIYGSSKALCESTLLNLLGASNQVIVLRSSWIFGPYGNNFVKTILKLLKSNNPLKVIDNQIGSPTSSISLAKACIRLINVLKEGQKIPPILHWTDLGIASWYELAVCISEQGKALGLLADPPNIIPIKDIEYISSKAIRPAYSVLDTSLTREILNLHPISWRDSLNESLNILLRE